MDGRIPLKNIIFVNCVNFVRWHATLNIDTAVFISTFLSP